MTELLTISYSPWSEKARWALHHHGIHHREVEYLPIIGELALRKRLGKWRGKITVPLLIKPDGAISDSLDIARYAEEIGSNPTPLFPREYTEEVVAWNVHSESALAAGRALVTIRTMKDSAARSEAMPRISPVLAKILRVPFTAFGAAYLRRKYHYGTDEKPLRDALYRALFALREALADGRPYLLGEQFSYADLTMACALQCVRPVTDEFIKLGPASRTVWTDETYASEFSTLLDWRDQVYQTHRLA